MMRASATALVLAAAAALAFTGAAGAQDDEEETGPLADASLCGRDFAASGATSNVVYAASQLRTCDALVDAAGTAAELNAAAAAAIAAHAGVLARWRLVTEELLEAAGAPTAARPSAGGEEENGAPADPWTAKLAERHALETAMDGLRILMRLSYQLADTYADPAALTAALEGPAAARVNELLADRQVCSSPGRVRRPGVEALPPSWLAYATLFPTSAEEEPITYEREVVDLVAAIAEAFVATDLPSAPELAITRLQSFETKSECGIRDFPSERDES